VVAAVLWRREREIWKIRGQSWLWFLSPPSCIRGRGAHERCFRERRTAGMQKAL